MQVITSTNFMGRGRGGVFVNTALIEIILKIGTIDKSFFVLDSHSVLKYSDYVQTSKSYPPYSGLQSLSGTHRKLFVSTTEDCENFCDYHRAPSLMNISEIFQHRQRIDASVSVGWKWWPFFSYLDAAVIKLTICYTSQNSCAGVWLGPTKLLLFSVQAQGHFMNESFSVHRKSWWISARLQIYLQALEIFRSTIWVWRMEYEHSIFLSFAVTCVQMDLMNRKNDGNQISLPWQFSVVSFH